MHQPISFPTFSSYLLQKNQSSNPHRLDSVSPLFCRSQTSNLFYINIRYPPISCIMAEHPLSDSISTEIVASKVFAGNFSSKRLFERSECRVKQCDFSNASSTGYTTRYRALGTSRCSSGTFEVGLRLRKGSGFREKSNCMTAFCKSR